MQINKEQKCPNCNSNFKAKENINRITRNVLYNLKFNCPLKCGDQFTYENKESHMNECMKINCVAFNQRYDQIEFAEHIENCQKRTIYCLENEIYFPFEVKEYYEKYFKKIIFDYKTLFTTLNNIL